MKRHLAKGECGPNMIFVDTFNMTYSALQKFGWTGVKKYTYDGFHYGMTINLLKTQIILERVASVLGRR